MDGVTALVSGNNAEHFADKILELYHNEKLWNALHQNSTQPLEKFSVKQQEQNIKSMFEYLGFK